ncbi:hypothetical protein CJ030_MR7G011788 [Morella rubra]|uniref:Uncharacterized protein n=1 Tax=Morella rubra TaxID=262757 RepID=A0A6A1V0X6_9ROSI|nr:hypothetical protein CJ030_MR7G011788 [Morella rubra]
MGNPEMSNRMCVFPVFCQVGWGRSNKAMSRMDNNPGRHFFGCASYNCKTKACGFFDCFDPRTCPRGMEVGPYITKKIKDLQCEVRVLKQSVTILKCLLGVSWAAIAIMGVLLLRSSN